MSGFPLPPFLFQAFNNSNAALAGGLVYSYAAGTLTPLATYSDYALTVPNPNPTVLDASGRAVMFAAAGVVYDMVVRDSLGNTIYSAPGVSVPSVPAVPVTVAVPTGAIMSFGGAAAPTGFLLCDGSAVSRSTYAALFAVLGTTFGNGNGSTTFNVPDLRQRFPLGLAPSGTGSAMGQAAGAIDHVHTGPSHTHSIAAHTHTLAHTHSVPNSGWTTALETPPLAGVLQAGGTGSGSETNVTQATANNATGNPSTANTGAQALNTDAAGTGNTGASNPPFLTVQYIVKT